MREILFKAKRIDNGEWIIGSLIKTKKDYYICEKPYECMDEYSSLNGQSYGFGGFKFVDQSTICQYTGFTDKNGQKIWENDVVKKEFYTDYDNYANSEEYIGFVKFEDCAWVIETKVDNRICTRPIIESMAYSEDIKHFEVIGNIFDNPELLNE